MAGSDPNPGKPSAGKARAADKRAGTGFPLRPFVAALSVVAVLLAWHIWRKSPPGLSPGIFGEAFHLQFRHKPNAEHLAKHALGGVQTQPGGPNTPSNPAARPPVSTVFVDDSGALDPFFAALWQLEQARPKSTPLPGPPAPTSGSPPPGTQPVGPGKAAATQNTTEDPMPEASQSPSGVSPEAPASASGSADAAHTGAMPGTPSAPPQVVAVLHYGDSPTTADLITGDVRALLQARFGDAGHGFNLPAKPWAWYGHRDVALSDHGWKASTPVGSMREGVYGLGGATLTGESGTKSTFKLSGAPQTTAELSYLQVPNGGSFTLSAGDQVVKTVSTDASAEAPGFERIALPPATKDVELAVTSGTVRMLGVDFRTGTRGVLYDSMGLNGASTTVMSRGFARGPWTAELQHANPALVVINYGTNESSFGSFVTKGYENELRLAVAKIRAALPDVPILIMSPMDRGERAGLNDIETMATIPQIVDIQRRVAADLHCGFFDTFDAMGGDGTMATWYTGKPRLVSADLIHPTPQGALIVAQQLVSNLMLGYDRWKRLHGIAVPVATPPPVPGAPAPATAIKPVIEPAKPVGNAEPPSARTADTRHR